MSSVNRIALVTGGNRGLGRSIANQFAKRGTSVVITYNTHPEEGQEVVAELEKQGVKAAALQLDVSKTAGFEKLVSQFVEIIQSWGKDKFDIFVPCAGVGTQTFVDKADEESLDQLFAIHLKAPVLLLKLLLPHLREAPTSVIITLSTGLARFTNPGFNVYAPLKAAVEGWTRYLAVELGPKGGIRAVCVRAGIVVTDFGGGWLKDNKDVQEHFKSVTALRRLAYADDIGKVVASVASDDLGWVTGTVIEASGGQQL